MSAPKAGGSLVIGSEHLLILQSQLRPIACMLLRHEGRDPLLLSLPADLQSNRRAEHMSCKTRQEPACFRRTIESGHSSDQRRYAMSVCPGSVPGAARCGSFSAAASQHGNSRRRHIIVHSVKEYIDTMIASSCLLDAENGLSPLDRLDNYSTRHTYRGVPRMMRM